MALLEEVLRLSEEYAMLPQGGGVLCALSGGADSVCLLHLLKELSPRLGFALSAAHYDHGLRGEESKGDAAFAARLCRDWGIPFYTEAGDVAAQAAAEGRGLEETGRDLRYAFLQRAARQAGAARIATAHNADDNAETLLLHLVRGCGLKGLTGIPPRRGNIVRPLLTATRREILAYLEEHALPHREDSSNRDPAFARNRLRLEVMPVLEALNPQAIRHMGETIARLRRDNDVLTAQAARAAARARTAEDSLVIEAAVLTALPQPVALRCAGLLLERAGLPRPLAPHLEALLALARSGDPAARADLPGLTALRVYGDLLLAPAEALASGQQGPPAACAAALPGTTLWGSWTLTAQALPAPPPEGREGDALYLDREALAGPLTLRARREGDRLALPGRPERTLKKWMIDGKIPRSRRDLLPVLADGAGVVAVAGLGVHTRAAAAPGRPAWVLRFSGGPSLPL